MKKSVKIILIIIVIILIGGIIMLFLNKNKAKKVSDNDISKTSSSTSKIQNNLEFGKYYINNSKDLEPIEWIKLDEKDGKSLLVTKYAIDSVPFNNTLKATSWDISDIREWLNNDFYNLAFSDEEKSKIILTNNEALENPNHPDNSVIGENTEDNVFLLSYQEVEKYFPSESDRELKPTSFAISRGVYTNASGNVAWWTRSAGMSETSPEYLASAGDFGIREHKVNEKIIGTRPAIWVK